MGVYSTSNVHIDKAISGKPALKKVPKGTKKVPKGKKGKEK